MIIKLSSNFESMNLNPISILSCIVCGLITVHFWEKNMRTLIKGHVLGMRKLHSYYKWYFYMRQYWNSNYQEYYQYLFYFHLQMLHVEDLQAIWVDMIDSISNLFCKRYLILRIRKTFYFYNEHVITLLVSDLFLNILHVPRELKYSILCRSRVNTLHWFTSISWW